MISQDDARAENKLPIIQPVQQELPSRMRVQKPKIDLKKCEKNFNCLVFCPHNAITIGKTGFPVIDYSICTGCLVCLRECPTFAITEEHEKREARV